MKVGSLFSGIGGFDLGFERAGFEVAWQCEYDRHARAVLARHWPGVTCYEDVRELRGADIPPVDVLCGGFPCQDLSVAGRRAGLAGERSGLWFEFHRLVAELRPAWVVIENVPGLRSSDDGRDLAVIIRGLAELGYLGGWGSVDAQWCGLAQRRERVFIVGGLGNGRASAVLPLTESLLRDTPARGAAWEAPSKPLGGSAQSGGYRTTDLDHGASVLTRRGRDGGSADEIEATGLSPALRTAGGDSSRAPTVVSDTLRSHPRPGSNSLGALIAEPLTANNTQYCNAGNNPRPRNVVLSIQDTREMEKAQNGLGVPEDGIAYTLDGTGAQGCYVPEVVPNAISSKWAKGAGGPAGDEIQNLVAQYVPDLSVAIAGGAHPGGLNGRDAEQGQVVAHARPRRLTPTECERLMGFADGWTAGQSDSHRYRQLGNAVCPPVAEYIARRIAAVLR